MEAQHLGGSVLVDPAFRGERCDRAGFHGVDGLVQRVDVALTASDRDLVERTEDPSRQALVEHLGGHEEAGPSPALPRDHDAHGRTVDDADVVERDDRRSLRRHVPVSFDPDPEDQAHRGVGDGRHDRPPRVELGRSHAADATPA
jgi:hypothetical protein